MTTALQLPRKVLRRARWAIRDLRPNRWVVRDIAGVSMAMPWSHRLPDFMRNDPAYGENLLVLAEGLAAGGAIAVLDVGANIGDSTMLVLDRAPSRVLAVEPDQVFLPFLRHNCGSDDRVVIEPSLLTIAEDEVAFAPTRIGGTATFAPSGDGEPVPTTPTVSVAGLRAAHPDFAALRLVKSDTDGYDVVLVPEIARVWSDARPVLFFEYDHRASLVADNDPLQVWDALGALGWTECVLWDNGGHLLRRCTLAEAREQAVRDEPSSPAMFWDVAAAHADDAEGIAVLDAISRG